MKILKNQNWKICLRPNFYLGKNKIIKLDTNISLTCMMESLDVFVNVKIIYLRWEKMSRRV